MTMESPPDELSLAASSDQSNAPKDGYRLVGDGGHLIVTIWHGDSPERELLWAKRILNAVLATRQRRPPSPKDTKAS